MKKNYIKPHVEVINLGEDIICTSSTYVGIGGSTGSFNSRSRNWSDDDDWLDE